MYISDYKRKKLARVVTIVSMSAVVGYDFTISFEKFPDRNDLMRNLCQWFKKWVFQKEEGAGGFVHWQGRGSLIKARRLKELVGQANADFPGVHWSVTSSAVHQGQSFNYVMKADSRVEGPWDERDYVEPPPLTRQLIGFMKQTMYPWQEQLQEMVKEEDDRSIKLIVDTHGNSGKSIFAEFLEYNGDAWEMPPFRLMEDIMQCCMCTRTQKCYLIDMPRAMKKDKLCEFYSGLEALKNGVCYDKRYAFKKRRFDRPQIVVFTNNTPQWSFMTKDRWEVYVMNEDRTLTLSNLEN